MTWSKDINNWQYENFGSIDHEIALERAEEEWDEMVEAIDPPEGEAQPELKCAMECADVVITLAALTRSLGFDLAEMVERKMEINRARKWRVQPDGKAYHVKEPG